MTAPVVHVLALLTSAPGDAGAPTTTAPPDSVTEIGVVSSTNSVIGDVWNNLGNNGYQTGVALIAATIAVIAMANLKVKQWVIAPVALGAFWAGWLLWNTLMGQDNPLFPGDPSATKIWDVALAGDTGFLIVVAVGCVAAFFLWRKGTMFASRVWLLVGATLGASFLYNLIEAVRIA